MEMFQQALAVVTILIGGFLLVLVGKSIWKREPEAAVRRFISLVVGVGAISLGISVLEVGITPGSQIGFAILLTVGALFHAWDIKRRSNS